MHAPPQLDKEPLRSRWSRRSPPILTTAVRTYMQETHGSCIMVCDPDKLDVLTLHCLPTVTSCCLSCHASRTEVEGVIRCRPFGGGIIKVTMMAADRHNLPFRKMSFESSMPRREIRSSSKQNVAQLADVWHLFRILSLAHCDLVLSSDFTCFCADLFHSEAPRMPPSEA